MPRSPVSKGACPSLLTCGGRGNCPTRRRVLSDAVPTTALPRGREGLLASPDALCAEPRHAGEVSPGAVRVEAVGGPPERTCHP